MQSHRLRFRIGLIALVLLVAVACSRKDPESAESSPPPAVAQIAEPWTGDLTEALETRRFIRALVTYNQTNFFIAQGAPRGLEYELLKRYETYLNRNRGRGRLQIKIVFTVLPFAQLLPALKEGRGDIVAAGMTITPQRLKQVDFARPYLTHVDEVVVTGAAVNDLRTIDDLSARRVHVLRGSSYASHLRQLNRRLRSRFLAPVRVIEADPHLEEEDILQMINAGIYNLTVVDDHLADLWSKVLPHIRVRRDIVVNSGGQIAWAVRKNNPQLQASLNAFFDSHRQGTFAGNLLIQRYYSDTRWVDNPLSHQDRRRFEALKSLFQKYARKYSFDWLKLAALAYQESHLDPKARSHRGAVGIMQLLPRTAAGPIIGIADIENVENNIHAGTKYLAHLRDVYFDDPGILPEDRSYFAIAAYNAGPARINAMRRKAKGLGLDPNRWFSNVEYAARRFIGREPVRYVSNIYIYYIAYRTAYRLVHQKPEIDRPDGVDPGRFWTSVNPEGSFSDRSGSLLSSR